MAPLIIAAFIGLFIVFAYFGYLSNKKRRDAMYALAAKLGLNFNPANDSSIANRYQFLNKLRTGDNRYAFNMLSGKYKDYNVMAFDFHYEETSTNSKGEHETDDYYFSFFLLNFPAAFPELTIGSEGFFAKIGQALGYDDIDFESHEFSRKFCVRSKDKKFAYDICNAKMIEYLLSNQDLTIEIENDALALYFNDTLKPEQIEHNLDRLVTIRSLMPNYLFDRGRIKCV
ncbi:MAG: hypothetical protein JW787_01095 [Sedimentisphaerales bacterium]|nr:hypothetical protein [Sedimentisphaerales bacterium]